MYLPAHAYVLIMLAPYSIVLHAWRTIFAAQAVAMCTYFAITLRGSPAVSGCRKWPRAIAWLQEHAGPALSWWMRDCKVHQPSVM
jgi:hypothetical protein